MYDIDPGELIELFRRGTGRKIKDVQGKSCGLSDFTP